MPKKTRNIYNTLKGSSFEGAVVVQKLRWSDTPWHQQMSRQIIVPATIYRFNSKNVMISTSMFENNVPILTMQIQERLLLKRFTFYNWDCDSEYSSPVNRFTDALHFSKYLFYKCRNFT